MKLFFTILLVMISFTFFAAASEILPEELCKDDVTSEPTVTPLENGALAVCSVVPTAFITQSQGKKAALGSNKKQAKAICPYGFSNVQPAQFFEYPQAVAAISVIYCK